MGEVSRKVGKLVEGMEQVRRGGEGWEWDVGGITLGKQEVGRVSGEAAQVVREVAEAAQPTREVAKAEQPCR